MGWNRRTVAKVLVEWGEQRMHLQPSTRSNELSDAIACVQREFAGWAVPKEVEDLRRELRTTTQEVNRALVVPRATIWALIAAQRDQTLRALMATLYLTAARLSDWTRVRGVDVLVRQPQVEVWYRVTKSDPFGVGRRTLFVPPRWLLMYFSQRQHSSNLVFLFRDHRQAYERVAAAVRGVVGTDGCRMTPHSFRRSAINHLLDGGIAPEVIMRVTGHKDVAGLLRYADRLPAGWMPEYLQMSALLQPASKQ